MGVSAVSQMPIVHAPVGERTRYLRLVGLYTTMGLGFAGLTAVASSFAILQVPLLQGRWTSLIAMLGAWGVANFVAPRMVFDRSSRSTQWAGFFLGTGAEGVAMGWLLLAAVMVSAQATGNPLQLLGQAGLLCGLAVVGMMTWLWSAPKDLSMVRAVVSALFLPMIALSILTFVFPIGGIVGIGLSAVFVGISVAGLTYQLNRVLHTMGTSQELEGSYTIALGVLVLFWNVVEIGRAHV